MRSGFLVTEPTINTRMKKTTIIIHSRLINILLMDNFYKQKGERNRFNTILKAEKGSYMYVIWYSWSPI